MSWAHHLTLAAWVHTTTKLPRSCSGARTYHGFYCIHMLMRSSLIRIACIVKATMIVSEKVKNTRLKTSIYTRVLLWYTRHANKFYLLEVYPVLLAKRVCISRPTVACVIQIRKRGSRTVNPGIWLSYQEVPFEAYSGVRRRGNSQRRLHWQSDKIHTPSERPTAPLCIGLFTYRRSCFRPLCLPWCHPAASGGRSRVCSKVAWRCPSAGALQSKHRVKCTLAFRRRDTLLSSCMHTFPSSTHAD